MEFLDRLTEAELARLRKRWSTLLGAGAVLQGGQYAFRPSYPTAVYSALGFGSIGWAVFGLILIAGGIIVLLLDTPVVGHVLATFCYGVLAVGQIASPPHGLPILLMVFAGLHFVLVLSVRDVWGRTGVGRVGRGNAPRDDTGGE